MPDREQLQETFGVEAIEFAEKLAEGAIQHGRGDPYTVRLVKLRADMRGTWEAKRWTLSNHIKVGAYAVILQEDGSRWLYTTTTGKAQVATLQRWTPDPIIEITGDTYETLRDRLEDSLAEAMIYASTDGRSRRVTTRGFDYDAVHARREELAKWERIADGIEPPSDDDLEGYLEWWEQAVTPRVTRAVGGLPVDREVYAMAERRGWVGRYGLVSNER